MSDYSPSAIVQAADTKVKAGDIAGAEMIYKDALLNWEDDAREGSNDIVKMANTMADLWCAYADFFRNLKKVSPSRYIFTVANAIFATPTLYV